MNEIQYGLLVLIRSALDKKAGTLPEGFAIESAEELIIKHQIVGLAYEGAVLCGISPKEPVMQRLFQKYYQQILRNQKQTAALNKLFAAFDANNIDYLPVKGMDLKALYPDPAMRTMGDADVLIRMEQYDRIRELMQILGYTEGKQTGHELIWDCPALHLELHSQLLSSYHPDLQRYYGDGWKRAKLMTGNHYTYSLEDMYIFLFAHFVKHYRRSGIGIRHVLDIWLFGIQNPTMDTSYIRQELAKMRLCEFYDNMRKLMDYWFCDAAADEMVAFISAYIFKSGSWGDGESLSRFIAVKNKKLESASRFRQGVRLLFPNMVVMKKQFAVLKQAPWLLPFLWPVRWIRVLLFQKKDMARVRKDWKYSSDKAINTYEEALHYVGLHYDG